MNFKTSKNKLLMPTEPSATNAVLMYYPAVVMYNPKLTIFAWDNFENVCLAQKTCFEPKIAHLVMF